MPVVIFTKKKRSKYNNVKTIIDGITFDSKAEAAYYSMLCLLRSTKEVSHFLRQVPFDLPGKVKYRLDFLVFYANGIVEYIDVKGISTSIFKLKKKQVEALYPVKIKCVKQTNGYHFKEISV